MIDDAPGEGLSPSILYISLARFPIHFNDGVSVWKDAEEPSVSVVEFEFNRNLPNIVPEEDIVLNYELASYIQGVIFITFIKRLLRMRVMSMSGYSWSGDYLFSDSGTSLFRWLNNHLNTSGYRLILIFFQS